MVASTWLGDHQDISTMLTLWRVLNAISFTYICIYTKTYRNTWSMWPSYLSFPFPPLLSLPCSSLHSLLHGIVQTCDPIESIVLTTLIDQQRSRSVTLSCCFCCDVITSSERLSHGILPFSSATWMQCNHVNRPMTSRDGFEHATYNTIRHKYKLRWRRLQYKSASGSVHCSNNLEKRDYEHKKGRNEYEYDTVQYNTKKYSTD